MVKQNQASNYSENMLPKHVNKNM